VILRCLVCEEDLESLFEQPEWPHAAVVAIVKGNYGSTVYDPPISLREHEHLRVLICDECLKVKARNGFVLRVQVTTSRDYSTQPWRSDE
jgi:hypothetical protein